MNKKYNSGILAIALVMQVLFAQGQSGKTVQGLLRDTAFRVIAGASVQLTSPQDSLVTSSSVGGVYTFNNVQADRFIVRVNSIGFEPYEKEIDFPKGESKMMIPSFVLVGIPNMLEEVVINGVITVQVKGDTVEYSTKDLKLREGALAEDALKKLQGVEVDKDGNVTAQGEEVTRVRINGKDFFGGDVKTATQNLPANVIEKMQIIDDYGDMANVTGNKSGDSEKVLNIVIDPEYNKGYMTTLRVGGGTEERYQATGMWMGLNNNTQVSVLGNLNNMNARLFDFQSMGGGARRRSGGGGGRSRSGGMFGGSEGITNTGSIGVNIRHDFSEKLKTYGSYSYGRDDNDLVTNSFTEYIGQDLTEEMDKENNNIRANHRFEGNLEWNITDKDYIKITPQLGFDDNSSDGNSQSTFIEKSILDNFQDQTSTSSSTAPRYNFSGLYNRKLSDNGRNLFIDFNYDNAVTESDFTEILDQKVYDPANQGEQIGSVYEEAIRDAQNKSWNAGTSVAYTEPLSEKGRLELTYDYNINDYDNFDRQDQHAEDQDGNDLSNPRLNYDYNYDYQFTTHRFGASYRFENDKVKYSFGASVQPSLLQGDAYSSERHEIIERKNFNFVPIARFEYKFSRQSNLSIQYSGRSTEPTVSQILPFEVSTNRTRTTIGNPDLDPEFNHSVNLRYRAGDFQKGKTFFAFLRAELTQDKIVSLNSRYNVSGQGLFQEIGYRNESDPVYSIRSFYHYGRSLKDKTYNIMYMGGVTYSKNISYLATEEDTPLEDYGKNITNNTILMQNLFFRYNPSENLELNPGVRYSYNITNSSLPQFEAPNITSIAPSFIGSVNLSPTTIFGADVSKSFNKGYSDNVNPFIINTYIEQRLLKGQRGTIRLQGFDLLNQQVNINRTVGEVLTDSRTNRLARYFMLTFTFRLQKFSGMAPQPEQRFPGGMRRPRM
ncbi:outer membrane beta-barrel protein [Sphingobacterium sp. SGG-5]|uniref:outer membrane beta-barrel protein n=1 Tax=Sphingobacterium sp. SGG-5 TaxID=2710881 RepID=UPI0013EC042D|nr:outer membrane beta-barrel protein [Sphingobacterium sp. SGG-5]NGM60775.1 outer membrane beta-barrel protein [Sphingobacterium sp. SGG-5]